MVERVHRVLKERLMARSRSPAWMDHLPLVLLGIRTSVRQDSDWCPAELVYGATLRLPGELLAPPDSCGLPITTDFVSRLRSSLAAMRPSPSAHHRSKASLGSDSYVGVPPSLVGASHVYVRVDSVRRPLSRPYEGPFRVLERSPKTFVLSRAGRAWTFSVDRLKPAWGFEDPAPSSVLAPAPAPSSTLAPTPAPSSALAPAPAPSPAPSPLADPPLQKTRFGRISRPPSRF